LLYWIGQYKPPRERRLRSGRCARKLSQYAETDISTKQSQARKNARVPCANEEQGRPGRIIAPPGPRPSQAHRKRRESRPLRQLIRLAAARLLSLPLCAPPTFEKCMTTARAFRAPSSPRFAWHAPAALKATRQFPAPGWASPFLARSVAAWTETASSGVCARPSACTAPNSTRGGISYSIRAGRRSRLPLRTSSGPSGK
jgi:hypothetical protein